MAVRPLDTNASVVFDSTGTARLIIGPTIFGETWRVRRMTVTSDSDSDSDARVYLNAELDSRLVAGTWSGNRDFNETDITLQTLDRFIVVWVGGTPGKRASFLVQGVTERRGGSSGIY
jgi:hypothetical protein